MKREFLGYWDSLWQDIPVFVWETEICALFLGIVVFLLWKGRKKGFRMSLGLFLMVYMIIIYCSTVIFRVTGSENGHDFMPFWSYGAYFRGENPRLLLENIMNMVVFVPVGVLLGLAFDRIKWSQVLIIGCCTSVSIEVLQFMLKRGFAEVDDVIHNTIGCVLGYILVKSLRIMVLGRAKR